MRFEAEYRVLQEPLYSSYCITYGKFKKAIKVEHGLAKKEGRPSDHRDTIRELEWQCQLADTLHSKERSRLTQLFGRSMRAHKKLQSGEYKSRDFVGAGMHICKSATEYTFAAGQSLLLFAKINTEAAKRLEKKIHRSCDSRAEGSLWKLPQYHFFYRTTASATYDFKADSGIFGPEVDDKDFSSLECKDVNPMLDIFLTDSPFGQTHQVSNGKQRLSSMIELFSFLREYKPDWYEQYKGNKAKYLLNEHRSSYATTSFATVVHIEIERLIEKLDRGILSQLDEFGRSPVHYAAEHGMECVVSALLAPDKVSPGTLDSWIDPKVHFEYQMSPLVLAVCSGRKHTIDALLARCPFKGSSVEPKKVPPSHLVRIAMEHGLIHDEFWAVTQMIEAGTDLNLADRRGQLLLCYAIHRGLNTMCPQLLGVGSNVNLLEPSSGRTPLCIACIRGNSVLVDVFLRHGADPTIADSRGWLPIEHAAYRGYLNIARRLASLDKLYTSLKSAPFTSTPLVQADRTKDSHIPIQDSPSHPNGHWVWINLGNNDAKHPVKVLQFQNAPWPNKTPSDKAELLYSIEASVLGKDGKPRMSKSWRLPLLESCINKPWLFETEDMGDLKLSWKLFLQTGELLATGISLLGALNTGSRPNRESVMRSTTVPIIKPKDASFAGSITFSYFWSKPHPPPQNLSEVCQWSFGNGIGGHRGSGKNMIDEKKLQIGENTAQSFSTAISHGASFLEFDVQVTKDLVPVVYHDFLISETGTDTTVQNLTYDQFRTINSVQNPKRPAHSRSNSMQSMDYEYLDSFKQRMDQTHFNKVNGFKANTRGNFIHEQTCSLDEVFRHVPASVPLNIELKYPMLFETEDWNMEPQAIKTDVFVDTILDKVYEYAEGRTIVFSSFSPEVCIALSTKQRSFPVFFLSKTMAPKGEIRSCCIQQAIHFAKSWGLQGVVAECTPFILCPRLIGYVRSAGLSLMSFGVLNSKKDYVKIQFDGGIDAVISDNIRAIKELRE